jgi:hypothetical protein
MLTAGMKRNNVQPGMSKLRPHFVQGRQQGDRRAGGHARQRCAIALKPCNVLRCRHWVAGAQCMQMLHKAAVLLPVHLPGMREFKKTRVVVGKHEAAN